MSGETLIYRSSAQMIISALTYYYYTADWQNCMCVAGVMGIGYASNWTLIRGGQLLIQASLAWYGVPVVLEIVFFAKPRLWLA